MKTEELSEVETQKHAIYWDSLRTINDASRDFAISTQDFVLSLQDMKDKKSCKAALQSSLYTFYTLVLDEFKKYLYRNEATKKINTWYTQLPFEVVGDNKLLKMVEIIREWSQNEGPMATKIDVPVEMSEDEWWADLMEGNN